MHSTVHIPKKDGDGGGGEKRNTSSSSSSAICTCVHGDSLEGKRLMEGAENGEEEGEIRLFSGRE